MKYVLTVSAIAASLCFATLEAQDTGKIGAQMGHMADHMAEMKGGHRQIADLTAKLTQSLAAIQAEKDPAALAAKLAEHGKLLQELQAKVQAHGKMMETMEEEEAVAPATEHQH